MRLIQGRQGSLAAAEQHALYNLLTRTEDAQAWQNDMNGIVGAINRESFPEQAAPPPVAPLSLEMIEIPAGNFTLGSSAADIQAVVTECNASEGNCQAEWFASETPARTIFVDTFRISKYKITNAQYNDCVNAGVCQVAGRNIADSSIPYKREYFADNFPAVGVGWRAFAQRRGVREGGARRG